MLEANKTSDITTKNYFLCPQSEDYRIEIPIKVGFLVKEQCPSCEPSTPKVTKILSPWTSPTTCSHIPLKVRLTLKVTGSDPLSIYRMLFYGLHTKLNYAINTLTASQTKPITTWKVLAMCVKDSVNLVHHCWRDLVPAKTPHPTATNSTATPTLPTPAPTQNYTGITPSPILSSKPPAYTNTQNSTSAMPTSHFATELPTHTLTFSKNSTGLEGPPVLGSVQSSSCSALHITTCSSFCALLGPLCVSLIASSM